jgi:hypothetical protein
MPSTPVLPASLSISPSGAFLAAGGSRGLQIFHFNGASPITSLTDVLTTDNIGPMLWDNNNHLYALTPFQTNGGNTSGRASFMCMPLPIQERPRLRALPIPFKMQGSLISQARVATEKIDSI